MGFIGKKGNLISILGIKRKATFHKSCDEPFMTTKFGQGTKVIL